MMPYIIGVTAKMSISLDASALLSTLVGAAVALGGSALSSSLGRRQERWKKGIEVATASRLTIIELQEYLTAQWRLHHQAPDPVSAHAISFQSNPEMWAYLRAFRLNASLIPDTKVRERASFGARALGYTSAIRTFGQTSELAAAETLCSWLFDCLNAYLRGDKQPSEPSEIEAFRRAIREADDLAKEL